MDQFVEFVENRHCEVDVCVDFVSSDALHFFDCGYVFGY